MAQAKVISEQELKRALGIVTGRKHAARDRLALLLTHWAGMRVCEVAALTRDTVLGPAGEILEEWRLDRDQTKGSMGRVVYANSKLRKEVAAYLKANPALDRSYPVLVSQKGNGQRRGFSANTLCQLINTIYREAGIAGATSHPISAFVAGVKMLAGSFDPSNNPAGSGLAQTDWLSLYSTRPLPVR